VYGGSDGGAAVGHYDHWLHHTGGGDTVLLAEQGVEVVVAPIMDHHPHSFGLRAY